MKFASATDRGLVREINEDSCIAIAGSANNPCVFIIADGMGGHNCGEIASRAAVEYIKDAIACNNRSPLTLENCEAELRKLVEDTNTAVYRKSLERLEANGMGTTLTMAVVINTTMIVAHVGDSRLYLMRSGNIMQVTEDHSYIEELVRNGTLTREEAENHPRKHVITRAIGCLPELEVDVFCLTIEINDIFILCTDGLTNKLNKDEIDEIVRSSDPEAACKQLIDAAKKQGGEDNITVIVIKCE